VRKVRAPKALNKASQRRIRSSVPATMMVVKGAAVIARLDRPPPAASAQRAQLLRSCCSITRR
jgi:hypothetical protein